MARIVVVDDDVDIRELLDFKLSLMGHEVHTAVNGLLGLETCEAIHPDLAIVDVNMPVMSGLDLVIRLRGTAEHRDLPIIMVTALAQADDVAAGLAAGATAYVTKPFSPMALATQVDDLLAAAG